jgi:two-component system response regulator RegX3
VAFFASERVARMPNDSPVIVIVTTHKASVQELQIAFEQAGYRTVVVRQLEGARAELGSLIPELILLHRPDCSLDSLGDYPAKSKTLCVSLWTNEEGCTEEQYERDIEAGADDVLSQLTPRQIVARVRALLRRRRLSTLQPRILTVSGIRMDLDKHEVTVNGNVIGLTPKEFAILRCFLEAPGQVFSRQAMLNQVWGEGYALEEHALDVHIHALRHKIEPNAAQPRTIVTVRGVGYKLKPPHQEK